jgi:LmbE family N-acetylglucosaminyl deacetylase
MTKRVLAVGAHPDDVEFLMAGTLGLLKDRGWETAIGILARGDCGTKVMSRREITAVRRAEAIKAAGILGAEIHLMGQNDLAIDINPEVRRIVTEMVRKVRPNLVLTHPPVDYMTDHEFTSRLVRDACFAASTPNYETEDADPAEPLGHIPALYYADPVEGLDIYGGRVLPQCIIDISAKIDLKREMLACHASQRDWLRAQHGIDQYLIAMEEWGRTCGALAGLAYGEGFRQHLGHAFPKAHVLAEELGPLVVSVHA